MPRIRLLVTVLAIGIGVAVAGAQVSEIKPAKGSALDVPAEPLTGLTVSSWRASRVQDRYAAPAQRVQDSREKPHSGPILRGLRLVTDQMLREPSPDDWLHWRRTYDGWGYSPLKEINRRNVQQLQLAWSWAMDPGSQVTTPLVHDGVMYLASPNSIVQALDAATGDLLWEFRDEADLPPVRREVRGLRGSPAAIPGAMCRPCSAQAPTCGSPAATIPNWI